VISTIRHKDRWNDPERRREAIDEPWAEDGVFYDPSKRAIRGRDEIDRIAFEHLLTRRMLMALVRRLGQQSRMASKEKNLASPFLSLS
jgi:hypothetical protein